MTRMCRTLHCDVGALALFSHRVGQLECVRASICHGGLVYLEAVRVSRFTYFNVLVADQRLIALLPASSCTKQMLNNILDNLITNDTHHSAWGFGCPAARTSSMISSSS